MHEPPPHLFTPAPLLFRENACRGGPGTNVALKKRFLGGEGGWADMITTEVDDRGGER